MCVFYESLQYTEGLSLPVHIHIRFRLPAFSLTRHLKWWYSYCITKQVLCEPLQSSLSEPQAAYSSTSSHDPVPSVLHDFQLHFYCNYNYSLLQ